MSKKNFDPTDVEAGREYVEAYVPYIHYVERLYQAAASRPTATMPSLSTRTTSSTRTDWRARHTLPPAIRSDTVTPQHVMTNEGCAATAAGDRAQCGKLAKVGEERKRQCEDTVNLRQRVCMIEVLEALHPDAARIPAGQTPRTPARQN